MKNIDLLNFKHNDYSQNGEDGIIKKIFSIIGTEHKTFCEFGAWDGIHFSNCRKLALEGWRGLFIEGDSTRYKKCLENYSSNKQITCIQSWVDTNKYSIDSLCNRVHLPDLDLLSIDIDGLDYEIFESLKIKPRMICVEVNAGHGPTNNIKVPRLIAKNNVGQSLAYFTTAAAKKGYALVGYTGNAFFVRKQLIKQPLNYSSPLEAYLHFLKSLNSQEREWLFLVNKGLVPPYNRFHNTYLSSHKLDISNLRKWHLLIKHLPNFLHSNSET